MEEQDMIHADMLHTAEGISSEESLYEAVAAALQQRGVDASAHHSGGGIMVVRVSKPPYVVMFGTAAEDWSGSVLDENEDYTGSELWTPVSTQETDASVIADGIAAAVSKLA